MLSGVWEHLWEKVWKCGFVKSNKFWNQIKIWTLISLYYRDGTAYLSLGDKLLSRPGISLGQLNQGGGSNGEQARVDASFFDVIHLFKGIV